MAVQIQRANVKPSTSIKNLLNDRIRCYRSQHNGAWLEERQEYVYQSVPEDGEPFTIIYHAHGRFDPAGYAVYTGPLGVWTCNVSPLGYALGTPRQDPRFGPGGKFIG